MRFVDSNGALHASDPSPSENPSACRRCLPVRPRTADRSALFVNPIQRPVSPRTISPDGRRQVPPGSRVPVIDPPDPQRGWQPPPNALHQKHFAPQSDGFDRMEGPERMLENPAAKRQSKEKSHGLFGD